MKKYSDPQKLCSPVRFLDTTLVLGTRMIVVEFPISLRGGYEKCMKKPG